MAYLFKCCRYVLETKRSQMILDDYIPQHKIMNNFLNYYSDYVRSNMRKGNRHLVQSLKSFRMFIGKDYISAIEINENLCEQFRNFLLVHLNGETPANYFSRFKRVSDSATKKTMITI